MRVLILHDTPKYKTGDTPHLRQETAISLIDTGYAQPYTEPLPQLQMHYSVVVLEINDITTLKASCNRCPSAPHGRYSYSGNPDAMIAEPDRFSYQHQCGLTPTRIPVEWIERYRAARAGAVYRPVEGQIGLAQAEILSNREAKHLDRKEQDRRDRASGIGYEGTHH
jgi:hypothetical protein